MRKVFFYEAILSILWHRLLCHSLERSFFNRQTNRRVNNSRQRYAG